MANMPTPTPKTDRAPRGSREEYVRKRAEAKAKGEYKAYHRLTLDELKEAYELKMQGATFYELADRYAVEVHTMIRRLNQHAGRCGLPSPSSHVVVKAPGQAPIKAPAYLDPDKVAMTKGLASPAALTVTPAEIDPSLIMTASDLADKIQGIVQKALARLENPATLDNMEGKELVTLVDKLVTTSRLLRDQSTKNISSQSLTARLSVIYEKRLEAAKTDGSQN